MKQFTVIGLAAASGLALLCGAAPAAAQSEPILGQVTLFATNWCPQGWLQANGATLPIPQYTALFSLYGTTYGGDGVTNFALPNLGGRAPVSWSGALQIGTQAGSPTTNLTVAQMPAHTHQVFGTSAATSTNSPAGGTLGTFPAGQPIYAANTATPDILMHAGVVGVTGGNQPVPIQSPVLAMNWCVATEGVYPQRP
jgi:microcystin-dependent protein